MNGMLQSRDFSHVQTSLTWLAHNEKLQKTLGPCASCPKGLGILRTTSSITSLQCHHFSCLLERNEPSSCPERCSVPCRNTGGAPVGGRLSASNSPETTALGRDFDSRKSSRTRRYWLTPEIKPNVLQHTLNKEQDLEVYLVVRN